MKPAIFTGNPGNRIASRRSGSSDAQASQPPKSCRIPEAGPRLPRRPEDLAIARIYGHVIVISTRAYEGRCPESMTGARCAAAANAGASAQEPCYAAADGSPERGGLPPDPHTRHAWQGVSACSAPSATRRGSPRSSLRHRRTGGFGRRPGLRHWPRLSSVADRVKAERLAGISALGTATRHPPEPEGRGMCGRVP